MATDRIAVAFLASEEERLSPLEFRDARKQVGSTRIERG